MLKKALIFISVILCFLILCSCTNDASSKTQTENRTETQTENQTETQTENQTNKEDSEWKVIRYPILDNYHNDPCLDYYEAGLLYPSQSRIIDAQCEGTSKKFVLKNTEYFADYVRSKVYENTTSEFLKRENYDLYVVEGKADFEVFKDTGFVKSVYIYQKEVERSEKIATDFSEAGLRSLAESLLTDLYGESILKHLSGYYQFEFAKLMEYANSIQNRYVVCYRAYLNGVPTDDAIYVHFSPEGALVGISAQKYLQYLNMEEASLLPLEQMEEAIRDELKKFDYSHMELRNNDDAPSCYYTMNSEGELYYVTEWTAFKYLTEDTGVTIVEIMAVKARES